MLSNYIIYFIVYSFLGWMYESLFYSVQFKKPVNTGFLHGCFCPIYGLACIANITLLARIENNLLIFLISMTAISAIEYAVSAVLENLFDKRWWDYSEWPVNINGRISLFSSLAFGVMSVLQLRFIHPYVSNIIESVPRSISYIFIFMTAVCIGIDLLITIKDMDKADDKLWFIDEESEKVQRATEKMEEHKKALSEHYSNVRERIRDRISR